MYADVLPPGTLNAPKAEQKLLTALSEALVSADLFKIAVHRLVAKLDADALARHDEIMASEGSGPADMRLLGQRGGLKSGEVRRAKRLMRLLGQYASVRGIELETTVPQIDPVERPNRSGGSHDTDWRCPYCRRINCIKRRSCAKCGRAPANGRLTRAARREREAEHRTRAMLKKHGL